MNTNAVIETPLEAASPISRTVFAPLFLILFAALSVWPRPVIAGTPFAPLSRPEGAYEFLWQEGYSDLNPRGSEPLEANLTFATVTFEVKPSIDLFLHLGGGNVWNGYWPSQTHSEENHLIGGGITKTLKRWKAEGSLFDNQTLIGGQVMGILPNNEAKWSEADLFVALKRRSTAPHKVWFHSFTFGGTGTYASAGVSASVSRTKKTVNYSKYHNGLFFQLGLLRFLGVEVRLNWERVFTESDNGAFSTVLSWSLPNGQGSPGDGNVDIAKNTGVPSGMAP